MVIKRTDGEEQNDENYFVPNDADLSCAICMGNGIGGWDAERKGYQTGHEITYVTDGRTYVFCKGCVENPPVCCGYCKGFKFDGDAIFTTKKACPRCRFCYKKVYLFNAYFFLKSIFDNQMIRCKCGMVIKCSDAQSHLRNYHDAHYICEICSRPHNVLNEALSCEVACKRKIELQKKKREEVFSLITHFIYTIIILVCLRIMQTLL